MGLYNFTMRVIAFETSCDETSVAVVESGYRVLSNITRTHPEHAPFGGVVPEIASRAHMRLIWKMTDTALKEAGVSLSELDGVAVTEGPGLIGALLVGVVFAKTLAQVLNKPLIGINHLEGHIFSLFLTEEVEPPILYLLVSGGHTELIWMPDFLEYEILGETLDDAAGEAFDKVAKLLGLGYPGGPEIDKRARTGKRDFVNFPRAKTPGFDFSFSGIKTSVLYYLREKDEVFIRENLSNIAASFQEAVVDMLLKKTLEAIEKKGAKRVAVVGGVSLNTRLREKFRESIKNGVELYFPSPQYCIDNAAMIGAAGIYRLEKGFKSTLSLTAKPGLRLS
jgi:N6-L-threonylcarbamoyladenine synthase